MRCGAPGCVVALVAPVTKLALYSDHVCLGEPWWLAVWPACTAILCVVRRESAVAASASRILLQSCMGGSSLQPGSFVRVCLLVVCV